MSRYFELVRRHGADILSSPGMRRERGFMQHGHVSVYRHSLAVAMLCVKLSRGMRLRVNERALVRGALLHDYFLYDWHDPDPSHKWHGFSHASAALKNARRDFDLSSVEENMIASHMFPLSVPAPRCRESLILWLADKVCATGETVGARRERLAGWLRSRRKGRNAE